MTESEKHRDYVMQPPLIRAISRALGGNLTEFCLSASIDSIPKIQRDEHMTREQEIAIIREVQKINLDELK